MPMRAIGRVVGRSVATISRTLKALGLSSLKALDPAPLVVRYERAAPGELLHIDTKNLGRIVRPSHRVTGDRRDSVDGAGWEFAHVAIDDHPGLASCRCTLTRRRPQPCSSLKLLAHYAALGVRIERVLTDNGPAYRSRLFAKVVRPSASSTTSPGRTGRKPTARPSASSRSACANGPTSEATPPAQNEPPGCPPSWPSVTPDDLTQPLATSLLAPASAGTTYCNSTPRAAPRTPAGRSATASTFQPAVVRLVGDGVLLAVGAARHPLDVSPSAPRRSR